MFAIQLLEILPRKSLATAHFDYPANQSTGTAGHKNRTNLAHCDEGHNAVSAAETLNCKLNLLFSKDHSLGMFWIELLICLNICF